MSRRHLRSRSITSAAATRSSLFCNIRDSFRRCTVADNRHRAGTTRVPGQEGRASEEGLWEEANRDRSITEQHRVLAESVRREAELSRALAEEARGRREQHREEMDAARDEREALRQAREEAREAAEEARHAMIKSVAATADALTANLAQMQFLENARNTVRHLRRKPDDVQ
jgi:hypothetical protein